LPNGCRVLQQSGPDSWFRRREWSTRQRVADEPSHKRRSINGVEAVTRLPQRQARTPQPPRCVDVAGRTERERKVRTAYKKANQDPTNEMRNSICHFASKGASNVTFHSVLQTCPSTRRVSFDAARTALRVRFQAASRTPRVLVSVLDTGGHYFVQLIVFFGSSPRLSCHGLPSVRALLPGQGCDIGVGARERDGGNVAEKRGIYFRARHNLV